MISTLTTAASAQPGSTSDTSLGSRRTPPPPELAISKVCYCKLKHVFTNGQLFHLGYIAPYEPIIPLYLAPLGCYSIPAVAKHIAEVVIGEMEPELDFVTPQERGWLEVDLGDYCDYDTTATYLEPVYDSVN